MANLVQLNVAQVLRHQVRYVVANCHALGFRDCSQLIGVGNGHAGTNKSAFALAPAAASVISFTSHEPIQAVTVS
ncbi:hypothetical protein AB0284_17835 [Pseudarthrobacter phenanthrenivorans]|uniref:hypothetical protein n=1 Tax=Pseudarthrobacter phenanthrenivorans TaxID=361575 RepID=UPI00344F6A72